MPKYCSKRNMDELELDPYMKGLPNELALFYQDNLFLLKKALDQGANINHRTARGTTPLLHTLMSYQRDSDEKIEFLLQHGADPNIQDNRQNYPLQYCPNIEILQLLIAYGARIDVPLKRCIERGCPQMLSYLIDCGMEIHEPQSPNHAEQVLLHIINLEQYRVLKAKCSGRTSLPIIMPVLLHHVSKDQRMYKILVHAEKIESNSAMQQVELKTTNHE